MKIDEKNKEIELLRELVNPEGKRVVEVGCGDGRISKLLGISAEKYVAVDVDEKAILRAKSDRDNDLNQIDYRVERAGKIDLPDEYADVVVMILALHEIALQDQGEALLEARRLLKKGGRLVIADPRIDEISVQGLYNAVYRNFKFFDHDYIVNHAKWVIEQGIKNNLFKLEGTHEYEVEWIFDNFDEVSSVIMNDFTEIEWTEENKSLAREMMNKVIAEQSEDKEILIYDKMAVRVLIK